jgi:DNA-binding TFAR19-related protein (PDSD5 family)
MTNETKFRDIPASACFLAAGEIQTARKNADDKSAALRMVARSGKPIEHPYWGNIVHDLAGVRLHKNRIPVDYVHDPKEIIGYLNHFDGSSGDLVTSGALVPFKDNDRATEILHKMDAGVPYEASINFGGDGIKLEDLAAGQTTTINGYLLTGPAVIVREWPLRGVAICPYGADMNTESRNFAEDKQTIRATVVLTKPETTEESIMENEATVEVATVEEPKPEKLEQVETPVVEVVAEEAVEAGVAEVEMAEVVETVEAQETPAEEAKAVEETVPQVLSREEFTRIADRFGNDIAAQIVRDGGDYHKAMELHVESLEATNKELRERVSELSQAKVSGGAVPVTDKTKTKNSLRELCEKGATSRR